MLRDTMFSVSWPMLTKIINTMALNSRNWAVVLVHEGTQENIQNPIEKKRNIFEDVVVAGGRVVTGLGTPSLRLTRYTNTAGDNSNLTLGGHNLHQLLWQRNIIG